MDPGVERLREEYNPPPGTPREEMWAVIEAGLGARSGEVVSLAEARAKHVFAHRNPLGWAAAAAAVLILGVGIGRMTAPASPPVAGDRVVRQASVVRAAALEHFGRSESLLTLARADARSGRVDPAIGKWARGLLTETRLLMDVPETNDPAVRELLEDLELVLVQLVGVADVGDGAQKQSELTLALRGLEESDVLSRIQAVLPAGPVLAGT
jgi:hypothetical protein